MPLDQNRLTLAFGLDFGDLYSRTGLVRLDRAFLEQLQATDPSLSQRLLQARAGSDGMPLKQQSELIIELAPHVEDFLAELFGIRPELAELQSRHHEAAPLYTIKRQFVQRKALTGMTKERASAIDGARVGMELEKLFEEPLTERSFALHVGRWLVTEKEFPTELALAAEYAAWATFPRRAKPSTSTAFSLKTPHKLDMHHLVPVETIEIDGVSRFRLPEHHWRHREGFQLTDPGMDLTGALDQAALLHQVPQPGQRQLLHRPEGEGRRVQDQRLRRHAGRLPARRENLRDERGQAAGQSRSARSPSSPSTTRWPRAPATASATTA